MTASPTPQFDQPQQWTPKYLDKHKLLISSGKLQSISYIFRNTANSTRHTQPQQTPLNTTRTLAVWNALPAAFAKPTNTPTPRTL